MEVKHHYDLGILGGMGPMATVKMYERIIKKTKAKSDQDHIEMVILNKCKTPDRTNALINNGDNPLPYLNQGIEELISLGCKYFIIPCNTAHAFKNDFVGLDKIEFLDMVSEAKKYLESHHIKAYVLCTLGTKAVKVYDSPNLEYLDANLSLKLMDIITKTKAGMNQLKELKTLIANLNAPVLLACTELSIYYDDLRIDNKQVFDAMDIIASKCIKKCNKELND